MNYQIYILLECFFSNKLDRTLSERVQEASESIVLSDWKIYLYEIYHHIGYVNSYIHHISETTYKKFKHQILLNLKDLLNEKIKN